MSVLKLCINMFHTDISAEVLHLIWNYPVQWCNLAANSHLERGVGIWWAMNYRWKVSLQQGRAGTGAGLGHKILLFLCSGTAVQNLQGSKTRRRSRKYSDEWEALRFWRLHCQEIGKRALQGASCSSRGVRTRLPQEVHNNRAGDSAHKCWWRRLLLDWRR